MKYALIGCSRIASNHVKAAKNNKLDILAVCDVFADKMPLIIEKEGLHSGVRQYTDYKEMVVKEKPDLISIATGSLTHAEMALFCIERGINVIVEKPIAMSITDADKIVEAAKKNNVKVCVCHQNRFNTAVQELKKAVEQGRFGRMSHGTLHVRWNRSQSYYSQSPWRGTWAQDGGCLMNQCIHGIDLLIWLLGGEVSRVYGTTRKQLHDYLEAEDVGLAILQFKNGVIAAVEGTVNVFPKNLEETLYIFGERGTVKLGGTSTNNIDIWQFDNETSNDQKNKGLVLQTSTAQGEGHTKLFADMIDAVKNNRKPYVDEIAGRNALEIVLAIYKSAQTGQPVTLPLKNAATTDFINMFAKP